MGQYRKRNLLFDCSRRWKSRCQLGEMQWVFRLSRNRSLYVGTTCQLYTGKWNKKLIDDITKGGSIVVDVPAVVISGRGRAKTKRPALLFSPFCAIMHWTLIWNGWRLRGGSPSFEGAVLQHRSEGPKTRQTRMTYPCIGSTL